MVSAINAQKRTAKSDLQLIQEIDKFTRRDYGGLEPVEAVKKDLAKQGFEVSDELALAIVYREKNQVEGVRKRTAHAREELKRRFIDRAEIEAEMDKVIQSSSSWKPKSLVILGFEDKSNAGKMFDSLVKEQTKFNGIVGAQLHKDARPFLMYQESPKIDLPAEI